jgi:hypothetical protein
MRSSQQGRESQDYLLSSDFAIDELELFEKSRGRIKPRVVAAVLIGFLIASCFWGLVSLNHNFHVNSSVEDTRWHWIDCGPTPATAKERGCKFQLWTYCWVPTPCSNEAYELEYLSAKDWGYYLHEDGKEEVNMTYAQLGIHTLWTTWGQHYWHCSLHMKNLVRGMSKNGSGIGLTDLELESEHMVHCLDALSHKSKHPWGEINDKMIPFGARCRVR